MKILTIAEIGSSHGGSLDNALKLIDAAKEAQADYAKFQLFTGDDLYRSTDPRVEATRKVAMPEEWISKLQKHCFDVGIIFLCTPFSPQGVKALDKAGVTSFKIASGDLTYTPLLEAVAETHHPVFLSVGASTNDEIDTALKVLETSDVVIMHCVPEYPATPPVANLRRIMDLAERYTMNSDKVIPVGLSSHLREWWVDVATVILHPYVIEKHIALEGRPGIEGGHSLDPAEFKQFVSAVRDVEAAMEKQHRFSDGEVYARREYRRSPSDWLRPFHRI